uniref:Ubiquitin-like protease family profile domain-containing protein n=1 Tax=Lactuca sativa TaxID=4236 RepID=A0A9R1UN28_LACSA|nr:hypothetical protein LSAT_V11C800443980 [Lactuca sativa]
MCTPFTQLHMTPKLKRRAKKKIDTKSTTPPPPPPVFGVAHDFLVLRLQTYIAGDREFWSALFEHTHNGWLDEAIRLLTERHFEADRYTIMPPNLFVCHLLEDGNDWRAFMSGIATYPDIMVTNFLDKINYWRRRNIPRRPLNMTFTLEDNVPQQSNGLGDCVVFVCMFMEQLVS